MSDQSSFEGKVVLIAAPSAAGKSTLIKHLFTVRDDLAFSVSATTRNIRAGEEHGRDYWFLSEEEFRQKIAAGEFLEYEENFPGRFYGTLASEADRIHGQGKHMIVDCEFRGAQSIKKIFGNKALYIFITAPSMAEFERRLRSRDTESESDIQERLKQIRFNLPHKKEADLVLVNDELATAEKELEKMVADFLDK